MEFKYAEDLSRGEPVAALYTFKGGREGLCLNVKYSSGDNSLWCYEDGSKEVQVGAFKLNENPVKVFYKDDEITIKF